MLYTFPRITPSLSLCAVAVLLPPPPHTHARCDALAHAHVQYGCTALWLACANKHEGAAAELMEATKLAGALDLQDDGVQPSACERSALHKASEGGLAGTVAQLVSLGADAALKDKVRACTCMRTWSYTYSMRVYSLGAYIRLCYKNRHIHT